MNNLAVSHARVGLISFITVNFVMCMFTEQASGALVSTEGELDVQENDENEEDENGELGEDEEDDVEDDAVDNEEVEEDNGEDEVPTCTFFSLST